VRPEHSEVPTLFITGAPGSGKTALAKEVSELLWRVDEPHAVVDLDELCRGVLPGGTADFNRTLAFENLAAVWTNFYAAGVRRLVLARVIQSAADLDLFAEAIPGCNLAVCRVSAERSTIIDRIQRREPGLAAAFLESVSRDLDDEIARLDLPGLVVENGDSSITDLALDVLERIDWPRPSRDLLG
jgi:dephospho-CoA kinase